MNDLPTIGRLRSLVAPIGGIAERVVPIPGPSRATDALHLFSAMAGNIGFVAPEAMSPRPSDANWDHVGGAGSDVDQRLAATRAVAECAERYANFFFRQEEIVVDTASGLGGAALDLDSIPRCSAREYADARCPLRPASKTDRLRWVAGWSLHARRQVFIPLLMTHLVYRRWTTERFWLPISTGVAAHVSPAKALVNAICEVIERDAVALAWLATLPLPRVQPSSELLAEWGVPEDTAIECHLYDATLDCGVSTVYLIQTCDHHQFASQVVGCATEFTFTEACRKVIRETFCSRTKFEHGNDIPPDVADFGRLQDGATYMGRPENRSGFSFLLDRQVDPWPQRPEQSGEDESRLAWLLEHLRKLGAEVFAVDLTTDELREIGLWTFRVVIPALMPMSTVQRARYLGHDRLYRAGRAFGRPDFSEAHVNPYPQPFA